MVSSDRKERMEAIATALANSTYDVVCLQEVWSDADFFLIQEKVKGTLPQSHYFYSGVVGSGVCIFTKHPIIDTHFHKWVINGYVHKVHHGDWFGGKGVALCKIKFHDYIVNVYSTHLHAEYNRKCDEYYSCRIVQAYETAQFIQLTTPGADLVVLAGDLNTEPGDLPYRIMTSLPQLRDSMLEKENVEKFSTNLDLKNSYTPSSLIKKQLPGVRIDYVLFRAGPSTVAILEEYLQPLPELVPNKRFSYSDHEAITSTIIIKKNEIDLSSISLDCRQDVLNDGIEALTKGMISVKGHKIFYWIATLILLTALILTFCFAVPLPGLFHVLRVLLTLAMCYTLVMATLWNMMEYNSLYSTKLAMQVTLRGLEFKS